MKQLITSSLLLESRYIETDASLYRSLRRWIAVMSFTLALTFDSFVFGCAIAVLGWIGAIDGRSRWSAISTALIAVGFPLLMLTAHCMDKIDAAGNAIRLQYCRENGLHFDDLF